MEVFYGQKMQENELIRKRFTFNSQCGKTNIYILYVQDSPCNSVDTYNQKS